MHIYIYIYIIHIHTYIYIYIYGCFSFVPLVKRCLLGSLRSAGNEQGCMHRRFERWAIGTICGSGSFKPPSGLDPCLPYGRQDQARRGLLYNATGRISYLWARPVREKRPGGRGIGGRREFWGGCFLCNVWPERKGNADFGGRPAAHERPKSPRAWRSKTPVPAALCDSGAQKGSNRDTEQTRNSYIYIYIYIYMHHIHPSILVYVSIRATSTHNL